MSSDLPCLPILLDGPLQAWGTGSRFRIRDTGPFPSRSAVFGIIAAAAGWAKGTSTESDGLARLAGIQLTAIAVRRPTLKGRKDGASLVPFSRHQPPLRDYHTVMNVRRADRGTKDCEPTQRYYLQDVAFVVLLEGDVDLLSQIANWVRDPVWGIWLGRKSCPPASPLLGWLTEGGPIAPSREAALINLLGTADLTAFDRLEEGSPSTPFSDGVDQINDVPANFQTRQFSTRLVRRLRPGVHA